MKKKMFSQACQIISDFGREEGYSKAELNYLNVRIKNLKFNEIKNWFLIFDALGCSDEKDEESNVLYHVASLCFQNNVCNYKGD